MMLERSTVLTRNADLLLVDGLAAGATALVLCNAGVEGPRIFLAVLLALVLPGYALGEAIFCRDQIGTAERLLVSLGLSMVLLVLGGIILTWTAVGLQARTWAAFLAALTLAASGVAASRRTRAGVPISFTPPRLSLSQVLLLVFAILAAASALQIGRTPAPVDGLQGTTLLWLLPPDSNHREGIPVGISSQEFTPTAYRLELRLDGGAFLAWPEIDLQPGEAWEAEVDLPDSTQSAASLEAFLYRSCAPGQVYRRAKVWLHR